MVRPCLEHRQRGSRNCGIDGALPAGHDGTVPPRTRLPLLRVLIVDDHRSFRHAARRVLEWRGYAVVGEAGSAAAAIDAAARVSPDAVMLDVRLRDGSGFDVARALTQVRPGLAVLLVSSADYRHCALVHESGASGFMLKSELAHADFAAYWPT